MIKHSFDHRVPHKNYLSSLAKENRKSRTLLESNEKQFCKYISHLCYTWLFWNFISQFKFCVHRFNLSEFTSGSLAPHANWGKSKAISHLEIISRWFRNVCDFWLMLLILVSQPVGLQHLSEPARQLVLSEKLNLPLSKPQPHPTPLTQHTLTYYTCPES